MSTEVKVCRQCGQVKAIQLFPKKRAQCKDCFNKHKRALYADNPEKAREITKAWLKANPEKAREYTKAWRKANPEKVRESKKAYYAANPEKGRERQKAYREANPEKVREYTKARRKANPEKERERRKAWLKANPEKAIINTVCQLLTQSSLIKRNDIPKQLIELKIAQLKLTRELRDKK